MQQFVPAAAPDHLDHLPAGGFEGAFQLLNNLAVAAHRAIQPLQVAVHDEDQVIEFFSPAQRNRRQRFRLIHLAVAEKRPHLSPRCGFNSRYSR